MRVTLYALAAIALPFLVADGGYGAPRSLINKKTSAAIGLSRPHDAKGGRLRIGPAIRISRPAKTESFQKNIAGVPAALHVHRNAFGSAPDSDRHVATAIPSLMPSQVAPLVKAPPLAPSPAPKFGPLGKEAVLGGSVMKPHTSTLIGLGGATAGKRTGEINGTTMRIKPH